MILKRARLKKLIMDMILTYAPRVAPGPGMVMRPEGRMMVLDLNAQNTAKLADIPDVTLTPASSGSVNLGPATSDSGVSAGLGARPPGIPTLGPGRIR